MHLAESLCLARYCHRNWGCPIFRDRRDFFKFLSLLEHFRKVTDSSIYAFAPMSFHVHLEAGCKDPLALATLLSCAYTCYYNARYHNGSAVFEHPPLIYQKKTLEWQVDNLLYIVNNPVVAGLWDSVRNRCGRIT